MVLSSLLSQVPGVLLTIAGIVLAVTRWQRHPTVSMLVVVGLTLRLFASFAGVMAAPMLRSYDDGSHSLTLMPIVYGGISLVGVVGLALLLAAAFAERGDAPRA